MNVRSADPKQKARRTTQLEPVRETKLIDLEESRDSHFSQEFKEVSLEGVLHSLNEGERQITDLSFKLQQLADAYRDSRMKLRLAHQTIQCMVDESLNHSKDSLIDELRTLLEITKTSRSGNGFKPDGESINIEEPTRKSPIFKSWISDSLSVQSKPSSDLMPEGDRIPSNFSIPANFPPQQHLNTNTQEQDPSQVDQRKTHRKKTLVRILGVGQQASNVSLQPPTRPPQRFSYMDPSRTAENDRQSKSPISKLLLEYPIKSSPQQNIHHLKIRDSGEKVQEQGENRENVNEEVKSNSPKPFIEKKNSLFGPKKGNFIKSGYLPSKRNKNNIQNPHSESEESRFNLLDSNRFDSKNTNTKSIEQLEKETKPLKKFPSTFFSKLTPKSKDQNITETQNNFKESRLQQSFFFLKKGHLEPPENL